MDKQRTIREFVEDLLTDGRSVQHILTVAEQTYYKGKKEEIMQEIERLSKFLKKDLHFKKNQ